MRCYIEVSFFTIFVYPAMELLAISIRDKHNIKSILIEGTQMKLSQLTDDTNCFISNVNSLEILLWTSNDFQQYARFHINVHQTKASYILALRGVHHIPLRLDWSEEVICTLEVLFSGNWNGRYDFKETRILYLRNTLNSWKGRKLRTNGSTTIINILVLSHLIYLACAVYSLLVAMLCTIDNFYFIHVL